MSETPTIVVKVGGSLFSMSDLPDRLSTLLETLRPAKILVVPGGGATADVVRCWDEVHDLSVGHSHRLALDTLALNGQLLASVMPELSVARCRCEASGDGNTVILSVPDILRELHAEGATPLPEGWHVTSDSIAAWIAVHWPADRLVLAKSVDVPQDLSKSDAVDPFFSTLLTAAPPIEWCNLRTSPGTTLIQ